MLIIGERINSTGKRVREAIRARDEAFIVKEAKDQIAAGAGYVDVNCAVTSGDELQDIDWAVNVIQDAIPDVRICIDSPNYLAIERALKTYRASGSVIINSITAEDERLRRIVPLAVAYKTGLIALTMDSNGMPSSARERADIARTIYDRVRREGFPAEKLYFDALIRPVSTEPAQAREFLEAIPMIKSIGDVRTVCGASNVSYGLPHRSAINAAFLAMASHAGLDAAILDPTDRTVFSAIAASRAVLGRDDYCADYIGAYRAGKLA